MPQIKVDFQSTWQGKSLMKTLGLHIIVTDPSQHTFNITNKI